MNKKAALVLKRISDRIPQHLKDNLLKEQFVTPDSLAMLDLALADPETPPRLKERLQNVKDSKALEQKEFVVDKEIEKQIDEWMNEEIQKAIKVGLLPKPKGGTLEELRKKGKQYARRSNKRSKKGDAEGSGEKQDSGELLQEPSGEGVGQGEGSQGEAQG